MSQSFPPPGNLSLGSGIIAVPDKSQVTWCCDGDPGTGALVPLEFRGPEQQKVRDGLRRGGKGSLQSRRDVRACLSGQNNPRERGPGGAAFASPLGLEAHVALAAGDPGVLEGLWPPHGICVFLESVVRGN